MARHPDYLKTGIRFGKYRIQRKLGDGGFAAVYKAFDTLEGICVALKVPHQKSLTADEEGDFRKEIRLAARLQHQQIMPLKSADMIEGRYALAYPLGEKTLDDRLKARLSLVTALEYSELMIDAVAFAHEQKVIHCDIKPDNFILTEDGPMLTDFGIAKVALRTVRASGSGTVGYCSPEQAMGKPSFRSDVFSLGLVIYKMFSGNLPEWPFDWPPKGIERLKKKLHPDFIKFLRKSIELDPRKRYASGTQMLSVFNRLKGRALKKNGKSTGRKTTPKSKTHWQSVQWKQFQLLYKKTLETNYKCKCCHGPVAEAMTTCPWCGISRAKNPDVTTFPLMCPRCHRGVKSDWHYCAYCYGGGFEVETSREFNDSRYTAKCSNKACSRKKMMPFMRYCPWCRRKNNKKWKIEGASESCTSCEWGVVGEFWNFCPWCGKKIHK